MSITVAQAELLALCFEIFFFGIFVILAVGVLIILLRTEGRANSSKLLPVGLALMLGLSLTHVLLSTTEDLFAFFSSEGAEKYYGKRSGVDALFLARGSIMNIQVITGDCINVWRLWIISNKRRLPVVPPVLGIVGYIVTVLGGSLGKSSDPFGLGNSWITACAVLTMYVNLHCTAVISWTIYKTRSVHAISSSNSPALIVIIESGALWTAVVVVFMVTYLASSFSVLVILDAAVPYVGIIFCLIVLHLRYMRYMRTMKDQTTLA